MQMADAQGEYIEGDGGEDGSVSTGALRCSPRSRGRSEGSQRPCECCLKPPQLSRITSVVCRCHARWEMSMVSLEHGVACSAASQALRRVASLERLQMTRSMVTVSGAGASGTE